MRDAAETLGVRGVPARGLSSRRTAPPDRLFAFAKGGQSGRLQDRHCRRRRCGTSAGHDGGVDGTAGIRRSREVEGPVRPRFALFHRPDAGRRPGRNAGDGQVGRRDAALLAASVLALTDPALSARLRPGASCRPTWSPTARRLRRDFSSAGETETRRYHRHSRRRTIGPDAGHGGGPARPALPGVFAGPGLAGLRRRAERHLRGICRCRSPGIVRNRRRRHHL